MLLSADYRHQNTYEFFLQVSRPDSRKTRSGKEAEYGFEGSGPSDFGIQGFKFKAECLGEGFGLGSPAGTQANSLFLEYQNPIVCTALLKGNAYKEP